ncbi:LrgB family protein [Acidocella sp.]|uniref:LrgB family protein n=1 Tax=Acidocella sp. TaxID=50710 RepID=UPI0026314188|nr:LrgB family protein [Acidocella sp.]
MHELLPLFHIWVYLQTQPLLWLTVTLCVWELARALDIRARHHALSNPTVMAITIMAGLLLLTRTSYQTYFSGAEYIQFLLGPATVALAVPMYANWPVIRRNFLAITVSLTAGSMVAAGSAMLILHLLHAPRMVIVSLGPKSVTTPIAMGISQDLGGNPSLTAVFVMITAMFGILIYPFVFSAGRITDWRARGLAAGVAMHGLGTARMLTIDETAGAFAGLAIGLNGVITSLFLPVMIALFGI